MNYLIY